MKRLHIRIYGMVQGVGFRPFVFRLAEDMNLSGWVENTNQGLTIEVEAEQDQLEIFLLRIEKEKPPPSVIQSLEFSYLDEVGFDGFSIKMSRSFGEPTALVLPDIAVCSLCLEEIFDPANRRFLYPFTNCTHCGPRFTIIESLPYDRPNTAMKAFEMCPRCLQEYHDPKNRRFHAQPNACSECGPHLELLNSAGQLLERHHKALLSAVEALNNQLIIAVKGIGGFQLMVDAQQPEAIQRLRRKKNREEKPLAVMMESIIKVRQSCEIDLLEERLLRSSEAPIVLLKKKATVHALAMEEIAPNNNYLGVMLPYSPLHHILLKQFEKPLLATSGNLSDEPICIDEREALTRLRNMADYFLVHNRPIVRHADDSVARIVSGREQILRRARGYVPLPIILPQKSEPVLAVGGQLKNSIAVRQNSNVIISQHIGDLETAESLKTFEMVVENFKRLYGLTPAKIVCDLHPEYLSSKYAVDSDHPVEKVQHHYAHVLSCMAENRVEEPVLGIAWDGSGYGTDGTIWGGEFIRVDHRSYQRLATFRKFPLPGGAVAIKEPRRTALGLLYEMMGDKLFEKTELNPIRAFEPKQLRLLQQILVKRVQSPLTSSVGRLFDAVSSIIGLRQKNTYEGQAAAELEYKIDQGQNQQNQYLLKFDQHINWQPMIEAILEDVATGVSPGYISLKFHNALIGIIIEAAEQSKEKRIMLTGGCFQNLYLTEGAIKALNAKGFIPYWHQRVPPNDGGICLGQIYQAERSLRPETK